MIKELFLPEKFRGYRLRSERQLGLYVQNDTVYAALVFMTASKQILEKVVSVPLVLGEGDAKQALIKAIGDCVKQIKRYDRIIVALPSLLGIYKELSVPFTQREKISMILDFEIEPLLPFSLHQGVIDFIVTKEEKKGAQVLAVAIRKHDLQVELDNYLPAQVDPDVMTIDFFALYGLYKNIREYRTISGGVVLIDLGAKATRLAFIYDGELRAMRHIQQGLDDFVLALSKECAISEAESRSQLFALNLTNIGSSLFAKEAEKLFMKLFHDIQFSLNSFSLKLNYQQGIQKILFTDQSLAITNLIPFCNHFLQISCELFSCQKLIDQDVLINKSGVASAELGPYAFALGAALLSPEIEDFNVRQKEFSKDYSSLMTRQMGASIFLILLIFTVIIARGYQEVTELSHAVAVLEEREIKRLKKIIPANKLPKKTTLQNLVTQAEKTIKERSDNWVPFSEGYIPPLEILAELTKLIDKKLFDVRVREVAVEFDKNKLTVLLEGHFKSLTGKDNYAYFGQFKKRFNESTLLELDGDVNERPQEELGIPFTVKLKPRTV